jgi:hypothetical protein
MPARPAGLSAICIIGLVLAGLGTLTWCIGGFGLVTQAMGNAAQPALGGGDVPEEMREAQQRAMEELNQIGKDWLVVNTAVWVWQTVSLVLLFVGCIAGLRMAKSSIGWLKCAMFNGMLFEITRLVVTILQQQETLPVVERMMNEMNGPNGQGMPAGIMQVAGGIAIAMMVAKTIALLAYYVWGAWYVSRASLATELGAGSVEDELPSIDDWEQPGAQR